MQHTDRTKRSQRIQTTHGAQKRSLKWSIVHINEAKETVDIGSAQWRNESIVSENDYKTSRFIGN
jgi:hypothetical protein